MKKLISILITLALCPLQVFATPGGVWEYEEIFTYLQIPYTVDYSKNETIKAVYADTGEIIPLSQCYRDRLYALVPTSEKDREIKAVAVTEVEFADFDPAVPEYYTFKRMSAMGVIEGNEKGEALPFNNITRAETVAVIMRLLGLKANDKFDVTYKDVTPDDWFYGVVAAATQWGIVEGTSDISFEPHRNVTREEFVVMADRAVGIARMGYPGDDAQMAVDRQFVSEWAQGAYGRLGNYAPSSVGEADGETHRFLYAQDYATRHDVVDMLYTISYACPLFPSPEAEEYGFVNEIPIMDGSTSTYPFTEAVYRNLFYYGENHPNKPLKHSKSHESYEMLISGEIDMMFASVYPASDILALAEEKGVEIELIPIAYDAMIFFTNIDNPIEGLTSEQITDIYVNNAYSNWNEIGGVDAGFVPYCRNNDSGSHAQMEKHFLKGKEIHPLIQAETTSVTMSNVLTDVMGVPYYNPGSYGLGYSIYYYFNNMDMFYGTKTELKLLAIDGIHPTDETITDGTYPLSNNTYIALRADTPEDAPARKMAAFMLSPMGQQCVKEAGFGPLK